MKSIDNSASKHTNNWDADSNRVQVDFNGTEYTYVYDTMAGIPAVLKQVAPSGTVYYIRELSGSLLARVDGSSVHYYHFDALGSTRLLTDADGGVTDRYACNSSQMVRI